MISNLDSTTLRTIRKGVQVTKGGGRPGLVVKTSRGSCLVIWEGQRYANTEKCRELVVVEGAKRSALTKEQRAEAKSLRERIRVLEIAKYKASAEALRERLNAIIRNDNPID